MGSSILNNNGSLIACNTPGANRKYMSHSISRSIYVGPGSGVTGDVIIKSPAFIGFNTVIKADMGISIFIGPYTSIHDDCHIYGGGRQYFKAQGRNWGIYIDGEVSILRGTEINGYCRIGKNTFIGQKVSISNARIMPNCVIMHGANISGGIIIPEKRFVKSGMKIITQADADNLPRVPVEYSSLNPDTIKGYMELMGEYLSSEQSLVK